MSGPAGVHRWVYAIPVLTPEYMRRRQFLRVASGAAGATAAGASGTAVAQEGEGGEDGSGGGGTVECRLVNYAYEPGTESPLYITPGTTVNFVWDTNTHNIVVDSQPGDANWEGYESIENAGFEYSHTFETMGEYTFHCQPHLNLGMEGTIVVNEQGAPPAPEGGGGPAIPQAATDLGVFATAAMGLVLAVAFVLLKYGGGGRQSSE